MCKKLFCFLITLASLSVWIMCFWGVTVVVIDFIHSTNQPINISLTTDTTFKPVNPYPFVVGIRADVIIDDKKIEAWGTGFVIDKARGLVVTAKHVVGIIGVGNPDASKIRVFMGSGLVNHAYVVWKHPIADVAVLQLVNDDLNVTDVVPRPKNDLSSDTPLALVGYQYGYNMTNSLHILRIIQTRLHYMNVSMEKISTTSADEETQKFFELQKENPKLKFEDVFYTKYLVINPVENTLGYFNALSGSPLLDNSNKVVGVFVCHVNYEMVFVPIQEIPEKYFGKNQ